MNKYSEFMENVATPPPAPIDILNQIEREVQSSKVIQFYRWSIAASIILSVATTLFVVQLGESEPEEFVEEDYFSYLYEEDFDSYTIYD